jgi:pilus assembly protein CpaF
MSIAAKNIPNDAVKRYISSAINVIIQVSRQMDGSRKLVSVQEITGMEGDIISMQEVFSFKHTGIDEDGKVKGDFKMNRVLPRFLEKFEALGVHCPEEIFYSE